MTFPFTMKSVAHRFTMHRFVMTKTQRAGWDTHVRECLRLLRMLQLASEKEQGKFLSDLVELFTPCHHFTGGTLVVHTACQTCGY